MPWIQTSRSKRLPYAKRARKSGSCPARYGCLGRLTPLHIPVSGYLLHPVVGIVDERPDFRAAEWEVARILEVPIAHFRDPSEREA